MVEGNWHKNDKTVFLVLVWPWIVFSWGRGEGGGVSVLMCMSVNLKNGRRTICHHNKFSTNFATQKRFFGGGTSKSTNLAKITLLVSMKTWSHGNFDEI